MEDHVTMNEAVFHEQHGTDEEIYQAAQETAEEFYDNFDEAMEEQAIEDRRRLEAAALASSEDNYPSWEEEWGEEVEDGSKEDGAQEKTAPTLAQEEAAGSEEDKDEEGLPVAFVTWVLPPTCSAFPRACTFPQQPCKVHIHSFNS